MLPLSSQRSRRDTSPLNVRTSEANEHGIDHMTRIATIIGRTRPGRNGLPPSRGQYQKSHTRKWVETIAGFDGHVVVIPEYNHSTSGALKNALDYLYAEWNNKAVGFVSYGGMGGVRAVEHLRVIAGEL